MQAPGGPEEDSSGGFTYGGWTVPYFDEFLGEVMGEQMGRPYELLLGRKTFDIFAAYFPQHEDEDFSINKVTKYVVSKTLEQHEWGPSIFLNDDVATQIKNLKAQDGPDLQVHGSGALIQTLLEHDLVDEFWLKIFPVTLGQGKRLFGDGTIPAAFELVETKTSPKGVVVTALRRAGEVETGSF